MDVKPKLVVCSPDGHFVLVGKFDASSDRSVYLWHVDTQCYTFLLEHPQEVKSAAFSPDSRRLLTVSDSHVYVWGVATGKVLQTFSFDPTINIRSVEFAGYLPFTPSNIQLPDVRLVYGSCIDRCAYSDRLRKRVPKEKID